MPAAFLRIPLAHRGLHDRARGRIENSRAGVEAAIEAGFGIEIDVQAAACGTAMVFHDDRLDRLTRATGRIRRRSAEDLGAIPLTGGGETIPTLAEILALVAGRVPLLIEVKDQDGALGPDVGPLEADVAERVSGYSGPLSLMSFNPHSVTALKRLCPERACGMTTGHRGANGRAAVAGLTRPDAPGVDFISHARGDLRNPAVVALRFRGLPVLTWTIRGAAEERAARSHADNITFEGYIPALPD